MLSPLLLKRINEQLGAPYIKQLRFKQVPRTKKRIHNTKQEKKHTVKIKPLSPVEQQALAQITDSGLKEAMKAFLIRCYQER